MEKASEWFSSINGVTFVIPAICGVIMAWWSGGMNALRLRLAIWCYSLGGGVFKLLHWSLAKFFILVQPLHALACGAQNRAQSTEYLALGSPDSLKCNG